METTNSDQSIADEPNAKRQKIESDVSTSSKPEATDPFLSLPSDVLTKIIANIPVVQWPALELLDKNFRASTLSAWRQLRNVNVERDFLIKPENVNETIVAYFESIIHKLVDRSPFLTSLSGIVIRRDDAEISSDTVDSLAQFEHLQSISMGDAILFGDDRQDTPLEAVVAFLESTRSRTSLNELHLFNIVGGGQNGRATVLDRFAAAFVNGREVRSPLLLEKFTFSSSDRTLNIRLDTIDTSRLIDLRLGRAWIEPDHLASLIERSTILRQIELSFLYCGSRQEVNVCNGPRLQANKNVLAALTSREHLTTIKFVCVDFCTEYWYEDAECTNFSHEFIEMLQTIGRRGRLRKLAMEPYFVSEHSLNTNSICAPICVYIPYLQAVRLHDQQWCLCPEKIIDIVSLVELEEIQFAPLSHLHGSSIEKIAQLPRLKRLAFAADRVEGTHSLKRLADVSTLMDLRIRHVRRITTDVFDKWGDGFASNLQRLMLDIREQSDVSEGLVRLLEKTGQLRVLILHEYITDRLLTAIAQSCSQLEIFGMRTYGRSDIITVRHIQEIVDRCPKLKKLGEVGDEIWSKLQLSKYRKINDVDPEFWNYDFDDDEYD